MEGRLPQRQGNLASQIEQLQDHEFRECIRLLQPQEQKSEVLNW